MLPAVGLPEIDTSPPAMMPIPRGSDDVRYGLPEIVTEPLATIDSESGAMAVPLLPDNSRLPSTQMVPGTMGPPVPVQMTGLALLRFHPNAPTIPLCTTSGGPRCRIVPSARRTNCAAPQ